MTQDCPIVATAFAIFPTAEMTASARPVQTKGKAPSVPPDKRFLRAIFRFADIARHAQTDSIDLIDVHPIQRLKGSRIGALRPLDQRPLVS